jgi:hypothetical protein
MGWTLPGQEELLMNSDPFSNKERVAGAMGIINRTVSPEIRKITLFIIASRLLRKRHFSRRTGFLCKKNASMVFGANSFDMEDLFLSRADAKQLVPLQPRLHKETEVAAHIAPRRAIIGKGEGVAGRGATIRGLPCA